MIRESKKKILYIITQSEFGGLARLNSSINLNKQNGQ